MHCPTSSFPIKLSSTQLSNVLAYDPQAPSMGSKTANRVAAAALAGGQHQPPDSTPAHIEGWTAAYEGSQVQQMQGQSFHVSILRTLFSFVLIAAVGAHNCALCIMRIMHMMSPWVVSGVTTIM